MLDEVASPACGDEVGLLEEIEEGILAPFGVKESLVAALGFTAACAGAAIALSAGAQQPAPDVAIDADDTTSMLFRMKEGMSGYLGTMTATGPGFSFTVQTR